MGLRALILLLPLLTAACGGGSGNAGTGTTGTSQPTYCCSALGPSSLGRASSTGVAAGPIAAAPSATFGTAPQQAAIGGGPAFDSGNVTNVTFPIISTGLAAGSPGLSALAASPGATATLTNSPSGYTLQLTVPSAGINATLNGSVSAVAAGPGDAPTWGYSYVVLGEWGAPSSGTPLQSEAGFAFGYETPTGAMPTTGTASFSGQADAMVYKSVGANVLNAYVNGNAAVTVNFASGQMTGALSQMQQNNGGNGASGPLPWNSVSLNANIAGGTNRFSGSTAATSAPGSDFSTSGSATGHVDGAFFGPAAQNLGALWSLSDGTVSAFGAIGAKQ
jgi:hypothetical protein